MKEFFCLIFYICVHNRNRKVKKLLTIKKQYVNLFSLINIPRGRTKVSLEKQELIEQHRRYPRHDEMKLKNIIKID